MQYWILQNHAKPGDAFCRMGVVRVNGMFQIERILNKIINAPCGTLKLLLALGVAKYIKSYKIHFVVQYATDYCPLEHDNYKTISAHLGSPISCYINNLHRLYFCSVVGTANCLFPVAACIKGTLNRTCMEWMKRYWIIADGYLPDPSEICVWLNFSCTGHRGR